MEFETISSTRMIALMVAGGCFAFAGLYMMLRPRPEGAAKIELFGLKFESSSAGLLVFIVGAAFLAVTLFVPERQTASTQPVEVPGVEAPNAPPEQDVPKKTEKISAGAIIKETEPNNGIRDAQPFSVGQTMSGSASIHDQDWFEFTVPPNGPIDHEIRLRYISGVRVRADVYNARGENVGFLETGDRSQYLPITSEFSDKLNFRVQRDSGAGEANYELAVLAP